MVVILRLSLIEVNFTPKVLLQAYLGVTLKKDPQQREVDYRDRYLTSNWLGWPYPQEILTLICNLHQPSIRVSEPKFSTFLCFGLILG